jgi:hypothetical protein
MSFNAYSQNIIEKVGLNRWIMAGGAARAFKGGVAGVSDSVQSFWDDDNTAFQRMGQGAAEIVGGMSDIGVGLAFGYSAHAQKYGQFFGRQKGASYNAYLSKDMKGIYGVGKGGVLNRMVGEGPASYAAGDAAKAFKKSATEGVWKVGAGNNKTMMNAKMGLTRSPDALMNPRHKGNFFKKKPFMFTGWGFAASFAVPLAIEAAASAVFSTAGALLDESLLAYKQAKQGHYDTRMFNNKPMQMWDQQNYGAAQEALGSFENKMMSISRIYHQR